MPLGQQGGVSNLNEIRNGVKFEGPHLKHSSRNEKKNICEVTLENQDKI